MSDLAKYIGSFVITLVLLSIPGLMVASFAFEWPGFLRVVLCAATAVEGVLTMCFIYEKCE